MRSRHVPRPVAITMLAIFAAAAIVSPAFAGSDASAVNPAAASGRPDASIRAVKSRYYISWEGKWITWDTYPSWQGAGTYNTTGSGQTASADTQNCCSEKHTFNIRIRNTGAASDRFKVKATGSGFAGWTTKYMRGTTNITSAVVAGTYRTPILAPGAEFVIKVKLVGNSDPVYEGSRLVTITSIADSTKKDAVKLKLKLADWCYC